MTPFMPPSDTLRLLLRDVQRSADRLLMDVHEARLEASLPGLMGNAAILTEIERWADLLMAIVAFVTARPPAPGRRERGMIRSAGCEP